MGDTELNGLRTSSGISVFHSTNEQGRSGNATSGRIAERDGPHPLPNQKAPYPAPVTAYRLFAGIFRSAVDRSSQFYGASGSVGL